MTVLLINPIVSEKYHLGTSIFPLGLGYIATALEKSNFTVEVLDIFINQYNRNEVISKLENIVPKSICVGITGMISGFNYIKWLSTEIKKVDPNVKVVLGGPITNYRPDMILTNTDVDICCIGSMS